MIEHCAAQIANGQVIDIIVGNSEWATANLGGTWVDVIRDFEDESTYPTIGDLYDSKTGTFSPSRNIVAEVQARESAVAKLAALGLSEAEAKALFGGV